MYALHDFLQICHWNKGIIWHGCLYCTTFFRSAPETNVISTNSCCMSFFMNKEMSNYFKFNQTQPTQHLPMHQLSPVVKGVLGLYADRARGWGFKSLFSPCPSSAVVYGYTPRLQHNGSYYCPSYRRVRVWVRHLGQGSLWVHAVQCQQYWGRVESSSYHLVLRMHNLYRLCDVTWCMIVWCT